MYTSERQHVVVPLTELLSSDRNMNKMISIKTMTNDNGKPEVFYHLEGVLDHIVKYLTDSDDLVGQYIETYGEDAVEYDKKELAYAVASALLDGDLHDELLYAINEYKN